MNRRLLGRRIFAPTVAVLVMCACPRNQAPDVPGAPTGPASGYVDSSYAYSAVTVDPDGDSISYRFAWSESDSSGWLDWLASGETAWAQHAWNASGTCHVRVQARDIRDLPSPWSGERAVAIAGLPGSPPTVPTLEFDTTDCYPYDVLALEYRADDMDEDRIYYRLTWQDGDTTVWLGPFAPGFALHDSHAWHQPGEYDVRVQARDTWGLMSGWSEPVRVLVRTPRCPYRLLARFAVGDRPKDIAVLPAMGLVYVAQVRDSSVGVYRTSDYSRVTDVPVGGKPFGLAVQPGGMYLYVADGDNDVVAAIRTSDNTVAASIPVGSFPFGVAFLPDGSRAYAANSQGDVVAVIDPQLGRVVDSVPAGTHPQSIAVSPNGEHAYVGSVWRDSIWAVEIESGTVVAQLRADAHPYGIAASPNGEYVYVACGDTSVMIIRTSDHAVVNRFYRDGEFSPYALALDPTGKFLYVPDCGSGYTTTLVIRTDDLSVVHRLVMPRGHGIAFDPICMRVYIAHADIDSVSVLGL